MEELKLIVEMVAQLGDQGKEAFIWYLVIHEGTDFVFAMSFIGMASYIAHRVLQIQSRNRLIENLRDEMMIGSPGELIDSEVNQMIAWVRARK